MAKKATARKRKTKTPPPPAHPDLGKEFYVATTDGGMELIASYQSIDADKNDALDTIDSEYGDGDSARQCLIFKVRIVEVGVDETVPNADTRKWYSLK
jgi:hypothetical protein